MLASDEWNESFLLSWDVFYAIQILDLVSTKGQCCKFDLSERNSPGTLRKDRTPPVTRIHPLFSASSTRFCCHRYLKSFRYFSIDSGSNTVSMGESTLYSNVKTSHPISPCEYSSIRASKRLRTSIGSYWALEDRMAVSKVAVRLCR